MNVRFQVVRMRNLLLKGHALSFRPILLVLLVTLARYQLLLYGNEVELHRRAKVKSESVRSQDRTACQKGRSPHVATAVDECKRTAFFIHYETWMGQYIVHKFNTYMTALQHDLRKDEFVPGIVQDSPSSISSVNAS